MRREDDRFATGRGQYADDLQRPDALRAAFVRSPYPSAAIRSIDTVAARQHPGVVAVLTGADMLADGFLDCPVPFQLQQGDGTAVAETPRPWLARDQVRYVGEPVVMVLARSQAAALDAAELVAIDYEERECVLDVASARASSAPQLWDGRVGNVAYHWRGGDAAKTEAALAASARVVRLTTTVTRVAAMPLEPRTALAYIGDDGRPVIHLSHQSPHQFRDELVKLFRLEPAQLRVIAGDVGGSFGMKFGPQREEVLVFWAALRTKQAVRWTAARGESFLADEHARDVVIHAELGLDAAGRFSALRVRYEANIGAYMSARSGTPISNIGGISGVYTLPAICAEVLGIFTNTQATAAYRGAGRPDATYAIERVIDHAAAETGIDPAELRRRNLIPADAMPYRTGFIFEYDCGDFARTLARGLELARYASFPQRREEAQGRGMLRGIGIALPIEQAGGIGGDRATVQAHEDGTFTIRAGSMSVGQGHETGFTRLVVQALGIDPDKVRYVQGDTDSLPAGRGNGGSSAAIQGGSAMRHAVDDFVAKARAAAASELEAHPADLELDRGAFRVRGTDHHIGFADLARKAQGDLVGLGAFQPGRPTFPNGCHVCEVEIDPATGEVRLVHYASVEDVGRVLNPVLVEGQIHGGVVQGIGQVLQEQICYDRYGQLLTGSFMDYALPRPADVPPMVVETMEIPTALNPLGVKGVGEAGTVGAMSAAMNAICHALRSAGVQHFDMPATPCRVWEALRS